MAPNKSKVFKKFSTLKQCTPTCTSHLHKPLAKHLRNPLAQSMCTSHLRNPLAQYICTIHSKVVCMFVMVGVQNQWFWLTFSLKKVVVWWVVLGFIRSMSHIAATSMKDHRWHNSCGPCGAKVATTHALCLLQAHRCKKKHGFRPRASQPQRQNPNPCFVSTFALCATNVWQITWPSMVLHGRLCSR